MHRMWAPWRQAYVSAVPEGGGGTCFLCDLATPGGDSERGILWRWEHWYAVLNAYPYTNGHLMLVLGRHEESFVQLAPAEAAEMPAALQHCEAALRAAYTPHGLNMGVNLGRAAGAGAIGHLHIHMLPRWHGDTNFMTTIGEARVLPESLESCRARLHDAFTRCRP
jgi:ATP adenylyltransferase